MLFYRFCLVLLLGGWLSFYPTTSYGAENTNRLTVYGGVTVFSNPEYDSVALVEFTFSLKREEFDFLSPKKPDSLYYTRIYAQVDLINVDGVAVDSAVTYFTVRVPSIEEATRKGYRVFNRLSTYVKPGVYSARLTVIDVVSKGKGILFMKRVVVPPPKKDHLAISDVCFAYAVDYVGDTPEGSNLRLVRNGFRIIPNPLSVYGTEDSTVSLYAEVYNLAFSEDHPSEYQLSLAAMREDSTLYRSFGGRVAQQPGKSMVIAESFEIRDWPPGLYYAQLAVTDLENGISDTVLAPFRIVSRKDLIAAAAAQQAFDPYDTLSLVVKEHLVVYLLTPAEKSTLSKLTAKGKSRFLDQYWREHDSEPSTRKIENRREMIERFEYINRFFSSNAEKTDGWLTDRGRIYMIYGSADDVKDVPAPRIVNPYSVWYYYHIKDGKFFVFEDSRGDDDYQLVHSNVSGEIYSKDWQEKINRGEVDILGF